MSKRNQVRHKEFYRTSGNNLWKVRSNSIEQLVCVRNRLKFITNLVSLSSKICSNHRLTFYFSGKLLATHVLAEVILGAELSGSIHFRNTDPKNTEDRTGNAIGKIVLGPISLAVKALQALVDLIKGKENPIESITLSSIPGITSKPTSVQELFAIIDSLDGLIASQNHFPTISTHSVVGSPIKYVLVPITKFLPEAKLVKLYKVIEKDVLDSFLEMVLTLKDYSVVGHLKKKLVKLEPRLELLLSDHDNPFTAQVTEREVRLGKEAIAFETRASATFASYKLAQKTPTDIRGILQAFWEQFNPFQLEQEVQSFRRQGHKELSGVLINDTSSGDVLFITNTEQRTEWLRNGRNIKLLLNSDTEPGRGSIFLTLYSLAPKLQEFGVSVAVEMPNVSDGFGLTLSIPGKNSETISDQVFDEAEAPFILEILAVGIGSAAEVATIFHAANAEHLGVNVPLEVAEFSDISQFIGLLKESQMQDFVITETFLELRDLACRSDGRLKVVLPVDAVATLSEAVEMVKHLKKQLRDKMSNCDWIVGKFGIENSLESPLLCIFKDAHLIAICLDKLDVLLLLEGLLNEDKMEAILFLLSPPALISDHNIASINRIKFGLAVSELFGFHVPSHEILTLPSFDYTKQENVADVVTIIVGISFKIPLQALSSIAHVCCKGTPGLAQTLKGHGWDEERHLFRNPLDQVASQGLKTSLDQFLAFSSILRSKLNSAIQDLTTALRYNQLESQPKLEELILEITMDISEPVQTKITSYSAFEDKKLRYEGILNELELEYGRQLESDESSFYVNFFIDCLSQFFIHDPASFRFRELGSFAIQTLVKKSEAIYQPYLDQISILFQRGNLYKSLSILAKATLAPLLFLLSTTLDSGLQGAQLGDPRSLKKILRNLAHGGFTQDNFKDCWSSAKIRYLMNKGEKDPGFMEALKEYVCQGGVPTFLPKELQQTLRPLLGGGDEREFIWNENLQELDDILQVFQEVAVRSRIPPNLQKILTAALNCNETLKNDFLASCQKVGFVWNEQNGYFEQPLNVGVIRDSVPFIMEYMSTIEIASQPSNNWAPFWKFTAPLSGGITSPLEITAVLSPNAVTESNLNLFISQMLLMRNTELCKDVAAKSSSKNSVSEILISFLKSRPSHICHILTQMSDCGVALPAAIQIEREEWTSCIPYLKNHLITWTPNPDNAQSIQTSSLFSENHVIISVITLDKGLKPNLNLLMKSDSYFSSGVNMSKGCLECGWLSYETVSTQFWTECLACHYKFCPDQLVVVLHLHGDPLDKRNSALVQEIGKITTVFIVVSPDGAESQWSALQEAVGNELKNSVKIVITESGNSEMPLIQGFRSALIPNHPNKIQNLNQIQINSFGPHIPESVHNFLHVLQKTPLTTTRQLLATRRMDDPQFQELMSMFSDLLHLPKEAFLLCLNMLETFCEGASTKTCETFRKKLRQVTTPGEEITSSDPRYNYIARLNSLKNQNQLNISHFLITWSQTLSTVKEPEKFEAFNKTVANSTEMFGTTIQLQDWHDFQILINFLKNTKSSRVLLVLVIENISLASYTNLLTTKMHTIEKPLVDDLQLDAVLVITLHLCTTLRCQEKEIMQRKLLALLLPQCHLTLLTGFSSDELNRFGNLLETSFIVSTGLHGDSHIPVQPDIFLITTEPRQQSVLSQVFKNCDEFYSSWETHIRAKQNFREIYSKVLTRLENNEALISLPFSEFNPVEIRSSKVILDLALATGRESSVQKFKTILENMETNWKQLHEVDGPNFWECGSLSEIEAKINHSDKFNELLNCVDSAFRLHRHRAEEELLQFAEKSKEELIIEDEIAEEDNEDDYSWLKCKNELCEIPIHPDDVDKIDSSDDEGDTNQKENEDKDPIQVEIGKDEQIYDDREKQQDEIPGDDEAHTDDEAKDTGLDDIEDNDKSLDKEAKDILSQDDPAQHPALVDTGLVKNENEDELISDEKKPDKIQDDHDKKVEDKAKIDATVDTEVTSTEGKTDDTGSVDQEADKQEITSDTESNGEEENELPNGLTPEITTPDMDDPEQAEDDSAEISKPKIKVPHFHRIYKRDATTKEFYAREEPKNKPSPQELITPLSNPVEDWTSKVSGILDSLKLVPFSCSLIKDDESESPCQPCTNALETKSELESNPIYTHRQRVDAERQISLYIKNQVQNATGKLRQMSVCLELGQALKTATVSSPISQQLLLETFSNHIGYGVGSEQELKRVLSLLISVPPSETSLIAEVVDEYGASLAFKFILPESRGFGELTKIKAFTNLSSRSPYLSQNDAISLKQAISATTNRLVMLSQVDVVTQDDSRINTFKSDTFDSGIVKLLRDKVEDTLKTQFPMDFKQLRPQFRWAVHREGIKRLRFIYLRTQTKWDSQYNPIQLLKKLGSEVPDANDVLDGV